MTDKIPIDKQLDVDIENANRLFATWKGFTEPAKAELKPPLGPSSIQHDPLTCPLCVKYRKESNDAS